MRSSIGPSHLLFLLLKSLFFVPVRTKVGHLNHNLRLDLLLNSLGPHLQNLFLLPFKLLSGDILLLQFVKLILLYEMVIGPYTQKYEVYSENKQPSQE